MPRWQRNKTLCPDPRTGVLAIPESLDKTAGEIDKGRVEGPPRASGKRGFYRSAR